MKLYTKLIKILISLIATVLTQSNVDMVVKESMTNARDSFRKLKPSDPQDIHEVLIAITQRNLDQLHDTLMDRGTPGHPLYQQWLTFEQIGDLVHNEAALAAVESWLKSEAIEVTWRSPRGEYMEARARIEEWERVLSTRFYEWHDTADGTVSLHHRSESYSVPSDVSAHISAIFNTCQVPPVIRSGLQETRPAPGYHAPSPSSSLRAASTCLFTPCDVDVPFINALYGITSNTGNVTLSQAVMQINGMNFSQADLAKFQSTYSQPLQKAQVVGTTAAHSASCSFGNCGEGSLDIQYIMGVAQKAKSIYWYVPQGGDKFYNFIYQVASTPNPPTSLSISWSTDESYMPSSYLNSFNTEAMKVTAMGVTIFASSGDTGVSGGGCRCSTNSSRGSSSFQNTWSGSGSWKGVGYFPIYPASSPYVVSVGATQGPEYRGPEVVCQANAPGGVTSITSGGGFSTYFPRPSYQNAAVSTYLASTAGKASSPGFNSMGRGYPDISFIGNNFPVYVGGTCIHMCGTSASAPVAAALITLVNSQRLARGLSTVGFIHPTLYANAGKFNDITSGSNNCCSGSSPTCCSSSGFSAGPGWDPASGLGSIAFGNLVAMFLPSSAPPIPSPSSVPVSSAAPVLSSTLPSTSPSTLPSTSPSNAPALPPSVGSISPTVSSGPVAASSATAKSTVGVAVGVGVGVGAAALLALAVLVRWVRGRASSKEQATDQAPSAPVSTQGQGALLIQTMHAKTATSPLSPRSPMSLQQRDVSRLQTDVL